MRHLVNMQRLTMTEDKTEVDYLQEQIDWKAIISPSAI